MVYVIKLKVVIRELGGCRGSIGRVLGVSFVLLSLDYLGKEARWRIRLGLTSIKSQSPSTSRFGKIKSVHIHFLEVDRISIQFPSQSR